MTAFSLPGGPILVATGLGKHFGGVHAVQDVDFRVEPGELRCLIGPNGAGKSTFFKMLTGQLQPSSGNVVFKGIDITRLQPHVIARLGMGIKTQVPSLFDGLSVAQNLRLAAARHQRGAAVAATVAAQLEELRLTAIAGRLVGQLAHGERQVVELGVVLAANPELILLDEPAAGMTQEETDRTAALIRQINRTHTLIVVEHDMNFIRQIASRVSVFNRGTVLVEGDAADVLADARVRDIYLGRPLAA